MKTFRNLYFRGTPTQLEKFVCSIGKYAKGDWLLQPKTEQWKDYLFFEYHGATVEKANVSIYIGKKDKSDELQVGNIIPREKNQLSTDEYNAILLKFYEDVIEPYKQTAPDVEVSEPSDEIFDPCSTISKLALIKLETFCRSANKSTGSAHPNDKERWFDFICQTVEDNKMFDYSTLAQFLQDEEYWGKKPEEFIGVMGAYAWSEDIACELASEYEAACEILQYYKKSRGI